MRNDQKRTSPPCKPSCWAAAVAAGTGVAWAGSRSCAPPPPPPPPPPGRTPRAAAAARAPASHHNLFVRNTAHNHSVVVMLARSANQRAVPAAARAPRPSRRGHWQRLHLTISRFSPKVSPNSNEKPRRITEKSRKTVKRDENVHRKSRTDAFGSVIPRVPAAADRAAEAATAASCAAACAFPTAAVEIASSSTCRALASSMSASTASVFPCHQNAIRGHSNIPGNQVVVGIALVSLDKSVKVMNLISKTRILYQKREIVYQKRGILY